MAKRGLSKEIIFDTAYKVLNEKGYENFSLREIASRLNVKPSSLYNHIDGLDEINREIVFIASKKIGEMLKEATEGKPSDEAFVAGAVAYRRFAIENPELYKAYIKKPQLKNHEVMKAGFESFAPLREIILSYNLNENDTLHFIRGLRSFMCGFIELTNNGYMQKGKITGDDSYETVIKTYLKVLKELKA